MPKLLIIEGQGKGIAFEIGDGVRLGRSNDNQIQLSGAHISRNHAEIHRGTEGYVLKDLGSRNGVLVNGRKVSEQALAPGDVIQIGTVLLAFEPSFEFQAVEGMPEGVVLVSENLPEPSHPPPTLVGGEARRSRSSLEETAFGEALGDLSKAPVAAGASRDPVRTLQTVYQVTSLANSASDPRDLGREVLGVLLEFLDAERGVILLSSEGARDLRPLAVKSRNVKAGNLHVSRAIVDKVLRTRKPILSQDASADPQLSTLRTIRLDHIKSVLCAPLASNEKLLGLVYLDTQNILRTFTVEDTHFLANACGQIAIALEKAGLLSRTQNELVLLRHRLKDETRIVGDSPAIQRLLAQIAKVAGTDSTVLLTGETGTGKELVARALHEQSPRRGGPFLALDCTAIPSGLLESELFGHEKGAFTGADRAKPGKFELAQGGTLFLDEIGELGQAVQAKLLRALDQREFTRVGGVRLVSFNARILAATNRDLTRQVQEAKFREDLYYRLAVVPIEVPPLRKRSSDVPLLAEYFLEQVARRLGRKVPRVSPGALEVLERYGWPGNVRELRNVIERVVVLCDGEEITLEELPPSVHVESSRGRTLPSAGGPAALGQAVAELERRMIERAMEQAQGKKVEAARILGISRPTLDKKLREYDLE